MLKNYFKIAWRNIRRNKVPATINVLGLSLGICACIVIYTISSFEFGFDSFHPGKENIYRVMGDVTENTGVKLHYARLPFAVSEKGGNDIRGMEAIAGVIPYNTTITIPGINSGTKTFESLLPGTHYPTAVITGPEYFRIFNYQWLAGNIATALNAPLTVVLTENKARTYFGNLSPAEMIGRQLVYDDSLLVSVTGIIKDWDKKTDILFTDFISSVTLQGKYLKNKINTQSWEQQYMNTWTFIKLSNGNTDVDIDNQLRSLVKKYTAKDIKLALWLEPLSSIHFNADVIENPVRTADKKTLYILIGIAFFILALSVINFINLSTAQFIRRAKEAGIRKVLGSNRGNIMLQFLVETFSIILIAELLAVLFVKPVMNLFSSFIPDGIVFDFLSVETIIFLIIIAVVTSLLSGLYPAKVLSAYHPALVLKGAGMEKGGQNWALRKGLVVFQFAVAIVFIIGSLVIASQMIYTKNKYPGFNSEAVITSNVPRGSGLQKLKLFAEKLRQIPEVSMVALQWLPPMTDNGKVMQLKFKGEENNATEVGQVAGDENFIPLYEIKILAGRNLTAADSVQELVINESLLHMMSITNPRDAIGKMLYWNDKPYPVVGVVSDFHTGSFHSAIIPLCIVNRPERQSALAIKLASSSFQSAVSNNLLSKIENIWQTIYPENAFDYRFYDESLSLLYHKDRQSSILIYASAAITIFISCMGLLGLALYTTEGKKKEIGIRKILGAGLGNIILVLGRDFFMLVVVAFVIASPLAWYFMNNWLQNFAYHTNIKWETFASAALIAFGVTFLTIGFQTIKAALINPVKSLRTE
ncbi:MAG: ABC transporter permease [Bacteroidota bacterium]